MLFTPFFLPTKPQLDQSILFAVCVCVCVHADVLLPADRTVLLMNPSEVPADFVSVAEQLGCVQHSQRETYITLIKHAFQSTLGTKYPLHSIHSALQVQQKLYQNRS